MNVSIQQLHIVRGNMFSVYVGVYDWFNISSVVKVGAILKFFLFCEPFFAPNFDKFKVQDSVFTSGCFRIRFYSLNF